MSIKSTVARFLPPILLDAVRAARVGSRAAGAGDFEIVGPSWPVATGDNPGWEDAEIARAQAERWPQFVDACSGPVPLDVAHEAAQRGPRNMAFHNTYMTYGYVLSLASRDRDRLSMLDWGGGLGHYKVLAHALLPDLEIEYHCKDLPAFCAEGRKLQPEAEFHETDECLGRRYDLVMASGSLQCSSDWKAVASALAEATGSYLYLTRIPTFVEHPSVVVRQHAAVHGFNDDLLGWFINREELVAHAQSLGLTLVREFHIDERPFIPGAAEQAEARGFLFRRAG